ncbi:MAG: hypothetical protein N3H31_00035 [Candidatus Nezhaarchaeota archaeon]|nr:hypothetical protein [Candidatus Nezhaarchaeota archaeon]
MSVDVGVRNFLEATRGLSRMYFSMVKAAIDMTRVGMESYMGMLEGFLKQILPSEGYEGVRRTMGAYIDSQAKLLENFRKLLDALEGQQDSIFDRVIELLGAAPKGRGSA